jgi:hypothetical protein
MYKRNRLLYFFLLLVILVLGLASRRAELSMPDFIRKYAGDTLWALAAYLFLAMVLPKLHPYKTALYTWIFCVVIEVSELYKAPWIEAIRNTTLGALVLGFDFYWPDFLCYATGILLGLLPELLLLRRRQQNML